MKQLGLALLNYESAKGCFPPGVMYSGSAFPPNCAPPRIAWGIHLLPYLEQQALWDQLRFDIPSLNCGWIWISQYYANLWSSPTAAPIVYGLLCPSDPHYSGLAVRVAAGSVNGYYGRTNYAGFFGNMGYGPAGPLNVGKNGSLAAAFGFNTPVRMADITDGLSNTMATGEVLTGVDGDDQRGFFWGDEATNSQVYTQYTPNTPSADVIWSSLCTAARNQPSLNRPCLSDGSNMSNDTAAARSEHPGGVNVGMCDGSVHFVGNNIGLNIWQAWGRSTEAN